MVKQSNNSLVGAQAQLSTATAMDLVVFHDMFEGMGGVTQSGFDMSIRGLPLHSQPHRKVHAPMAPHAHYEAVQTPKEGFAFGRQLTLEVTTTGHMIGSIDIQYDLAPMNFNAFVPSAPGVLVDTAYYTNGHAYAMIDTAFLKLNGGDQYEHTYGDAFHVRRLMYDREPMRLQRVAGYGSAAERSFYARETQRHRAPLRFGIFEGRDMTYDSMRGRQGQLFVELNIRPADQLIRVTGAGAIAAAPAIAHGGITNFAFIKNEVRVTDSELAQLELTHGTSDDFDIHTFRYTQRRVASHLSTAPSESIQLTIRNLLDTIVMFARRADALQPPGNNLGYEWFDWSGVAHPNSTLATYPFKSWSLSNGSSLRRFENDAVDSDYIRHTKFASANDDRSEHMMIWTAAHDPVSTDFTGGIQLSGETNTRIEIEFPDAVGGTSQNWDGDIVIMWFPWMAAKYYTNKTGGLVLTKLYAE